MSTDRQVKPKKQVLCHISPGLGGEPPTAPGKPQPVSEDACSQETFQFAIENQGRAVERLEALAARVPVLVDTGVSDLLSLVASLVPALADARMAFIRKIKALLHQRVKEFDYSWDEVDGGEKQLDAAARVCAASQEFDIDKMWNSVKGSLSLLMSNLLPRSVSLVAVDLGAWNAAVIALSASSRVFDGYIDPAKSLWGGSGLRDCQLGFSRDALDHNTVTLTLDGEGDAIRGLEVGDFAVLVKSEDPSLPCVGAASALTWTKRTFEFVYTLKERFGERALITQSPVTVAISVFGTDFASFAVPAAVRQTDELE